MRRISGLAIAFLISMLATGCGGPVGDGSVDVAFIGDDEDLLQQGVRIGPGAQIVRASRWQGLVRLDPAGQIVSGLAERWIVTDDGLSYIFRLRDLKEGDGTPLTAEEITRDLQRAMGALKGSSFGLDLAKVEDIRALTGRVVEIRLDSPMPGLLQLLAQPELVIAPEGGEAELMTLVESDGLNLFAPLPPEARGLPQQGDWADIVRPVSLRQVSIQDAIDGFANDRFDVILGGRIQDLPLASGGPLSRGTVRLDPAIGLFGLDIARPQEFLETAANREALALALERPALVASLGVGGWQASARIVPNDLPDAQTPASERWPGLNLEQRRAEATRRVNGWKAQNAPDLRLSLWLPEGPGSAILFRELRSQYAQIGIALDRAEARDGADLALRDRVARFAGARWFLNQFNCDIAPAQCSPEADELVAAALSVNDAAVQGQYYGEAENTLTALNLYIPIGAPIRWSQVRADVPGFAENQWAFHPLFPMSGAPI
ncbi:peptide ABC transporter substrate-binding protein [Erythrobacter litoralis]|uniref:ABC transporter substrate-binding protein n=1 Tax=Erythrobacter litoralis TaxID=39960 RepID=UPI00243533B7|nr:ABC transporter substrate-binding protein [Erythrobacter litoralis]MDG6079160.1 peptide ABC transporter substrate-binding protein [Erythrobacter litoralis]